MGRRIRWLGVIMVVCLGLVVVQLVNIQLVKGKQLQTSADNPRVAALRSDNPRGLITAADGTVLAKSVPRPAGVPKTVYPFDYMRQYPNGPLFAAITGYDSPLYYGTSGIEEQYDAQLSAHQQDPQTLSQLLFREKLPTTTDDVSLTVEPALQQAAWNALTTLPPGENKDGAVVVLNPKTGAVLAMVSNPTFDPNTLVSVDVHAENLAYYSYVQKDREGYYPLRPIATARGLFPRVDHEGGDVHRRLQPQAFPGGLQLSDRPVPDVPGFEQAVVRPERTLRRHDGPDAAVLVRPGLRRARGAAGRADPAETGRALRL